MKTTVLLVILIFGLQLVKAQTPIKLWETEAILSGPESVVYDPVRELIYVSNFKKQNNDDKTGTEFISRLTMNGEILDLKWITGLSEPLGISIFNDQLYIVERKDIAVYDLKTNKITNRFFIDSCKVINDVTVGPDSTIYLSECDTKVTYTIKNGKSTKWYKGDEASYPNGILYHKGKLLVDANGDSTLAAIDIATKIVSKIAQLPKGIIDGVKTIGDDYLVSFFEGNLFRITSDGRVTELMNTRAEGINIADFEYVESKRLLLVPALNSNKVIAYRLE